MASETETIEQPQAASTVAELGLDLGFLADLVLKTLYYAGNVSGGELCERLAISITPASDVLTFLRRERLVEVTGGSGLSPATLNYTLTAAGLERATAAIALSGYVGPAPVPLPVYFEYVRRQSIQNVQITREMVERALSGLVLDPRTVDLVGQAFSAKRAFLLYGSSGNGKSTAADSLRAALPGNILIPHSVQVMHQVIQLYDPNTHELADEVRPRNADQRWVLIKRPLVAAAGELAASHLELIRDEVYKTYEAPIQMKANGGLLIIDDFGRQQLDAAYLLNRWIVPLEKGIDNLSLHNGARFQVPFDVIPLFITNRNPSELADDAFLRRIRFKVEIPGPHEGRFIEILKRECDKYEIEYDEPAAKYLIDRYLKEPGREMRGCHPRDIVEAIAAAANYRGSQRALTPATIDEACESYFLHDTRR